MTPIQRLRTAARLCLAAGERWVFRGGYGISQYMEGTGANLRLPLNPPFFFESAVRYDATSGPGNFATGFAELRPLDQPSGQVRAWDPNLRPQFTQQWNFFTEYLRDRIHVGQRRLRRPLGRPAGDADRRQPAAAGHRRPDDVAAGAAAPSALSRPPAHPTSRRRRRAAAATTTRCRRAFSSATWHGLDYLVATR